MTDHVTPSGFVGWDIGGAHLKAVLVNADGVAIAARQVVCPLWRGLQTLEQAIDLILREFKAPKHVVTMTGELVDIFPNRHAGVVAISHMLHRKLVALDSAVSVQYFTANHGLIDLADVKQHAADIASMNWLASVQFVAKHASQSIFMDIGSTTTDIAVIHEGAPRVRGFSDAERMRFDELVYTGVVRTPLMALTQKIFFNGQLVNVAAEHFATTADVYTLTEDLQQTDNIAETADGAEKNIAASARRIARMIGWDAEDSSLTSWQNLACAFKQAQLNLIKQALLMQLPLLNNSQDLQIVGAGVGEFLAKALAEEMGFNYVSASDFIHAENDVVKTMAKVCFPAYAVATFGVNQ